MVDLRVKIAGLPFKNPLILGAGPQTKNLETVKKSVKSGAGALVIRSLHPVPVGQSLQELFHVIHPRNAFNGGYYSFCSVAINAKGYKPPKEPTVGSAPAPNLDQWTEEVKKMAKIAREEDVISIASIGVCRDPIKKWVEEAKRMEEANVDAIELHLGTTPVLNCGAFVGSNPNRVNKIISAVKEVTSIPIFTKITIDSTNVAIIAKIAKEAGTDAIVITGRYRSIFIDTDLETQPVWYGVHGIGGPWVVPILCDRIYSLKKDGGIGLPTIPTGGVTSGEDLARYLLVGADGIQICSQILLEGYKAVHRILNELELWMRKKKYSKITDFQGKTKILETGEFITSHIIPHYKAVIDQQHCTKCGFCFDACYNNAIEKTHDEFRIIDDNCQGCRACYYVCPSKAISINQ